MRRIALFMIVVLATGWGFGYLLAQMADPETVTPRALVISFAAVLTPALMAWLVSDRAGRRRLVDQLRYRFTGLAYAVALFLPALLHLAGAFPRIVESNGKAGLIPGISAVLLALQMLPMTLVWGALEEIGWRGFLVSQLARFGSATRACLAAGLAWGLWHAPQVWFSDLPYGGAFRETPWLGAGLWIAAAIAYGAVLGWLQITTGSFVLPAVSHALINVVSAAFAETRGDALHPVWGGTGGLAAILAAACLALVLFRVVRLPDAPRDRLIAES